MQSAVLLGNPCCLCLPNLQLFFVSCQSATLYYWIPELPYLTISHVIELFPYLLSRFIASTCSILAGLQPAHFVALHGSLAPYYSACITDIFILPCIQVKEGVTTQQLWCNSDIYHFDLSYWAFQQLAHPTYGVMMVDFRYHIAADTPFNGRSSQLGTSNWHLDL